MFKYILLLSVILSTFSYAANPAAVTTASSTNSNSSPPVTLPTSLTRNSVAVLLSDLSDKEVRDMLKTQLNSLADKQQATQVATKTVTIKEGIKRVKHSLKETYKRTLNLTNSMETVVSNFKQDRKGYGYIVDFWVILIICLGAAFFIDFMLARFLRKKFKTGLNGKPATLKNKSSALIKILFIRFFNLTIFYIVAETMIEELIPNEAEGLTAEAILDYIYIARLTFLVAAVALSPKDKTLRLYNLECPKAEILTNRLIIISLIAASGIFMQWTIDMGLHRGESRLGFWFNLLFYASIMWLVWRSRHIFEEMLLNGRERVSASQMKFIKAWPKIVVILSALVWLFLEYVLANSGIKGASIDAAAFSLIFINFVPFINMAIFATVEYFLPVNNNLSERQISFQFEIQDNVIRASQLLLGSLSLFGLSVLWGIDYTNLSQEGTAEFILAIIIELISVPVLAYVVWLFIDTYVAYKLASEKPEEEEEGEESEGGVGLSRLATVLPLLRVSAAFVIIVFTIFGVFASLGINTTPLLAGASVVGLAIGFGAQTLVKDIVSGLFFLVDDAFRMGEYVDVGGIKGTVERIALRSLRLRHHLGPQHTIPYGEVATLTNFSRDWVIMKLRFRVPHDTDVNKIKKLFKKLGKELLEHPELGKDFLAPFKSQGVLEVDEIGMLIRGKFTAKPGGQFMIRKEIYVRVQKLFAENNIEFAKRRVEVQLPDSIPKELQSSVSAAASEAIDEKLPPKPA